MKTIDERAKEIMQSDGVPFVVARIRAAKEAYGIPDATKPMSKAEVRDVVVDGSIVPFTVLMEAASDERASPETRILASDKYLAHAAKLSEESAEGKSGMTLVVKGGLPD